MTSWSVDPVGGWWFMLGMAALLVAVLTIGPRGKKLTPRQRIMLLALRGVTALLLFLAMLRPTLVSTETQKQPGTLLLLADSSRSMTIEDSLGDTSRWQALKTSLTDARDQLADLAESWDLKLYRFDESTTEVKLADGEFELPENADGSQTAMGAALDDVLEREAQQRIVAVLVMSDGAQRAFAPRDEPPQIPVERLATDKIPLYTFTYGKPSLGLQSDVRVDDLLVNSVLFAETPATVQAMLSADGYTNQEVKVQLLWENAEGEMEAVDTRQVRIESGQRQYPLSLTYTPEKAGEFKVSVAVVAPDGELATTNNSQSTFVTVMKGGINVLYLAGAQRIGGGPGIEPRFVRAALQSYPDQHVRFDQLNYRRQQLDLREQLREGKFDVFLLGNVDYQGLSPDTWQMVADEVGRGAGLAMLGGFHSFGPGGFRGTPMDDVLPIVMGPAERQNFGEPPRQDMHLAGPVRMIPVAAGNRLHPIFQLDDKSAAKLDWNKLPALDGANRFDRLALKPNAAVVAEADDPQRSPLIVAGTWGEGRTAAIAFDTTWRWQMEGFGELQNRFWRQLVLWLSRKDDTGGEAVFVRLDQRRYQRGSRVEFAVGALDKNREPLADAQFQVEVEKPDGTTATVSVSRRGEEFVGSFEESTVPGDYQINVTATAAQGVVGMAQARFTVPDRDMELDQPAAEPTFMASLANLTADAGGAGLAPEELPDLLERLKDRTEEFEEEISTEHSLWDSWPMLLTLIGCLGGEWYLRKRWGMV
ncbi:MAG: glutamine amidotransferase [Bythopirellula sp.]|nr:glutamine amidotransferase [Bythopirellula sp.]